MLQRVRKSLIKSSAMACFDSTASGSALPSSSACSGKSPTMNACSAFNSFNLLLIDNSMLIRSIPSEYSPSFGSGITTSSLILKAFVWRAMAAVRARSSQNFLRASAETAIKPSPSRALHMRTMAEATCPTAFSSSDAISAIKTIFGRC